MLESIWVSWPKYDRRLKLKTSTMSFSNASAFSVSTCVLYLFLNTPVFSFLATGVSKTRSDLLFSLKVQVSALYMYNGIDWTKMDFCLLAVFRFSDSFQVPGCSWRYPDNSTVANRKQCWRRVGHSPPRTKAPGHSPPLFRYLYMQW